MCVYLERDHVIITSSDGGIHEESYSEYYARVQAKEHWLIRFLDWLAELFS